MFCHLSPIIKTFTGFAFEHYDPNRETPLKRFSAPSHKDIGAVWLALQKPMHTICHGSMGTFWADVRRADDTLGKEE